MYQSPRKNWEVPKNVGVYRQNMVWVNPLEITPVQDGNMSYEYLKIRREGGTLHGRHLCSYYWSVYFIFLKNSSPNFLANLSVYAEIDVDYLELSPINGITIYWVTYISGKYYKDTKFSGFLINIDVEYSGVLGTKET